MRQSKITIFFGAVVYCALAIGAASAGTIQGSIRYAGPPVERKKLPVTIDHYVCGKDKESEELVLSPTNGIRNAVVSLQGVPPGIKWPANPPPTKMDQQQCVFVPRVVVVPAGGTVEFLNSDRLLHNVRSDGKANAPFNRAQPRARTIAIVFKNPELLRVDCDLHSWMRGWVVVAEHPFYAVTNEEGEFVLNNVPPGKYTLQVWHERLGMTAEEVVVTGKETRTVTVRMKPS